MNHSSVSCTRPAHMNHSFIDGKIGAYSLSACSLLALKAPCTSSTAALSWNLFMTMCVKAISGHLGKCRFRVFPAGATLRRGPIKGPKESLAMALRFLTFIVGLLALAAPASAAEANHDIKGLYLLTDYPALTVQPGTTSTANLKLRNYALAPERASLSVSGVPEGWTATLLGGGQPVAAAMPATDDSVSLDLRL